MAKRRPLSPWNIISDVMTNLLGLVFIAGLVGFFAIASLTSRPSVGSSCVLAKKHINGLKEILWVGGAVEYTINEKCEAKSSPKGFYYEQASVEPAKIYGSRKSDKYDEQVGYKTREAAVNAVYSECDRMFTIHEQHTPQKTNISFILRGYAPHDFEKVDKCYYPVFWVAADNRITSFEEFNNAYKTESFNGKSIEFTAYKKNTRDDKEKNANYMCNYTYATQRAENIQKLCLNFASSGYYDDVKKTDSAINFFRDNVSIEAGVLDKAKSNGPSKGRRVDIVMRYTLVNNSADDNQVAP